MKDLINKTSKLANLLPETDQIESPFDHSPVIRRKLVFWQSRGVIWKKQIGNFLKITNPMYQDLCNQVQHWKTPPQSPTTTSLPMTDVLQF